MLATEETRALAEQLPRLFGYHLLVIDPPWETVRWKTVAYPTMSSSVSRPTPVILRA